MRSPLKLLHAGIGLALALNSCGVSPTTVPPPVPPPAVTYVVATSAPTVPPTAIPTPVGRTITVVSVEDSGPGTLRQALLDAARGDTITFDPAIFAPNHPGTISPMRLASPNNALPRLSQGDLTIDASNAGVILDGSRLQEPWVNALSISSDGNSIRGLQIVNFAGVGIIICPGSHNTIGGSRDIGTGPLGQGNLTSRNGIGVDLCDRGSGNTIIGNIIGTDVSASKSWGNKTEGIWIENGITRSQIGPDNVIAYNGEAGVLFTGENTAGSSITRNSIHDNRKAAIESGLDGKVHSPFISSVELVEGVIAGSACANCRVEIFSDSSDQGAVYEGYTTADAAGGFRFQKPAAFVGPHVTAVVIDNEGNTSEFANTIALPLQQGNALPGAAIDTKPSGELEDNRIGAIFFDLYHPEKSKYVFPNEVVETDTILKLGYKKVRLSVNNDIDYYGIDWTTPELTVAPLHDQFIRELAANGVKITLVLSFWDKDFVAQGGTLGVPRFKTEGEIQRYLDFVRFTASHFRGLVDYYEVWNEPNVIMNKVQWIEVDDYLNLVRRTVPVIRQEDPYARIVVGGTTWPKSPRAKPYLFAILNSDIMPLVDAVAWHPFYGTSPQYEFHRQYYYDYPAIVREIKDAASAHGFKGEYFADELVWRLHDVPDQDWPNTYSKTAIAKNLARGILMHLGMDIAVTQNGHDPTTYGNVLQNLCTSMAGAKPVDLPIQIESAAKITRSYGFSMPNGDRLIALWNDGVAVDGDPGLPATVTIPGFAGSKATGVDILNDFEQPLITSAENGNLVIRGFQLRDYPTIIRLSR